MVYKGCCKKMIVLKSTGSDLFEEAYLILNDKNQKTDTASESDMIKEANKIVSSELLSGYITKQPEPKQEKRRLYKVLTFISGFVAGAALTTVMFLIYG